MSRSAARNTGKANSIVCLSPCVCLTPRGPKMVPVPYMIVSKLEWSTKTISNTGFGGDQAFTMESRTEKVTGNEPGTGGGVSSGVNVGWCRPQSNKSSFLVEGHQVLQDNCVYEMNCAGPDGPSNTLGKLNYDDA
ncbi:PAAR-like domain-containing protein [Martelella sp. FOR1707]